MGEDRLGAVAVNKLGSKMKVVEYVNTHDITVLFEAGDMVHASWSDFCKGAMMVTRQHSTKTGTLC